ncbi:hypothetical protein EVAR_70006_1 [Eumeta japonica]|uniref:Uncharacterized protein n=1 Tax=Eumeta variegata TaxID=151549 RepID=A0A4C2AF68_EUMVA|nr:hypothetical protein EVAR_70006_1 [Eumeta japonica]
MLTRAVGAAGTEVTAGISRQVIHGGYNSAKYICLVICNHVEGKRAGESSSISYAHVYMPPPMNTHNSTEVTSSLPGGWCPVGGSRPLSAKQNISHTVI